jgi:hypothetical protein
MHHRQLQGKARCGTIPTSNTPANAAVGACEALGLQLPGELRCILTSLRPAFAEIVGEPVGLTGVLAQRPFRESPSADVPSDGFSVYSHPLGDLSLGDALPLQLDDLLVAFEPADAPNGTVSITFHPTGIRTLAEELSGQEVTA